MHDPRIGRFFAIDPLTADYPFYSPYAFSGNRVIDMVELEGLEPSPLAYIADGFTQLYNGFLEIFTAEASAMASKTKTKPISPTTSNVNTTAIGVWVESNFEQFKYEGVNEYSPSSEPAAKVDAGVRTNEYNETSASATANSNGAPINLSMSKVVNQDGSSTTTSQVSTSVGNHNANASVYVNTQVTTDGNGNSGSSVSAGAKASVKVSVPETDGVTTYEVKVDANVQVKTD